MNTALNKEIQAGWVISIANVVIGTMAAMPAVLCFLFTAEAYFPNEYSGTDNLPDPPADLETKILFSIASILLLTFYSYAFNNPFFNDAKKLFKYKRLSYWIQIAATNISTLALFIYCAKDIFIPFNLNSNAIGQPYIYFLLYLPFVPIIISSIGIFYNLKQNQNNISNES